jgi:tRNA(Ile)-lysidine synthase
MPSPWNSRAARLATLIPRERLHPAVVAWADARPARERWAVALSGGADSVCLLLLLLAHWPRRLAGLQALHFNHRLRGAAAAADARFCARLCRSLGVQYVGGAWTGRRSSGSEAAAREARFAFFDREMAARRIGVLWLGHQQDDVAETMLMRLTRGSGTAGLAAPRPLQIARGTAGSARGFGMRLRPLLTLKKGEIVAALRATGVPWREDASNRGGDFFRNRIRLGVLDPWIAASGRDALAGAALSRELLEEDDRALEEWTDSLRCMTPGGRLDLDKLAGLPRAVARRALHRWLLAQPRACTLSRQGFAELLAAVGRRRPTRQSLGSHGFAVIRGKWLKFEKIPSTFLRA